MKQLSLVLALPFLLVASLAQATPGRCPLASSDDELDELLEQPSLRSTKLVIKVTRICRDGVCVRVERIEEVVDTAEDAREALPELPPRRQRSLPAPEAAPAELEPAPLPARPRTPAVAECGGERESSALSLLNAHRASLGLGALRCDPIALKVARAHSQDMCDRRYFSHASPDGKAPWDRLRAAGARFQSAGENIASGYPSAREVHAGWLASPGHRQNMERAGMTRAAIGVVDCGGSLTWTQLFLR